MGVYRYRRFLFPAVLLFTLVGMVGCSSVMLQNSTPAEVTAPEQPADGYKVVKVKDGDSVVVTPAGKDEAFECHLYGIAAPEPAKKGKPGQSFAEEARAELARLVGNGPVKVLVTSRRLSGHAVCLIKAGNVDVNLSMIEHGYAWAYRKKLAKPFTELYVSAEEHAKTAKLGIWSSENPETPWEYRSRLKKLRQEEATEDL